MLKLIRWLLGRLILILDWLFSPTPVQRTAEQQQQVDAAVKNLSLYQFKACPFCVKVRRTMRRLNLAIPICDALNNETCRSELLNEGGQIQVPCLKIRDDNGQVKWLYESSAIVDYLNSEFGIKTA